jgi:hypothetical protein
MDRLLYCLDPATGETRWRLRTGGPLPNKAWLLADACYVATEGAGVFAANPVDGKLLWVYPEGMAFLANLGESILLQARPGQLHRLDPQTGKVLGRCPAERVTLVAPSAEMPSAFVGSTDGDLLCIRSVDQPYLTRRSLSDLVREAPEEEATSAGEDSGAAATNETESNPLASPSTSPPLVGRDQ